MDFVLLLLLGLLVINAGALLLAPLHYLKRLLKKFELTETLSGHVAKAFPKAIRTALRWLVARMVYTILAALLVGGGIATQVWPMHCSPCTTPPTYNAARLSLKVMSSDIANIEVLDPALQETYSPYESTMLSIYTLHTTMYDHCSAAKAASTEAWLLPASFVLSIAGQLKSRREECVQLESEVAHNTDALRQIVARIREDADLELKRVRRGDRQRGVSGKMLGEGSLVNTVATCDSVELSIGTLQEQMDACLKEDTEIILGTLAAAQASVDRRGNTRNVNEAKTKLSCVPG